ncbi:MAG: SDR family oxidoreductase [Planctomycetaceae bacterium]|nr:SDR family oxidoreductase [Planctomycetaceae bacterium]
MFASLSGKRIVVTGSSSGIGRAIALSCAEAGADIVVHCRSSIEQANQTADAARRLGVRAEVFAADLSDSTCRQNFVDCCFDSGVVSALVNNAGADLLTKELKNAPFAEKLGALLQTDVAGTVELSRAFGHRFREHRRADPSCPLPCIINIGWDQSDRGMEGDSGELFATAKNAIMGFSRSLAVSLAPDVRVNCIAPGWILTAWGEGASDYWQQRVLDETPMKRWGTPEDIANMARFLLSDEAGYLTGQVINVNGGAVR